MNLMSFLLLYRFSSSRCRDINSSNFRYVDVTALRKTDRYYHLGMSKRMQSACTHSRVVDLALWLFYCIVSLAYETCGIQLCIQGASRSRIVSLAIECSTSNDLLHVSYIQIYLKNTIIQITIGVQIDKSNTIYLIAKNKEVV